MITVKRDDFPNAFHLVYKSPFYFASSEQLHRALLLTGSVDEMVIFISLFAGKTPAELLG